MSITHASDRKSLENSLKAEMEKTVQALSHDYQKVRTGRASTLILDDVYVDSYGTKMKLSQVANVTTPEPKTITVKPFDNSMISAIEKAIQIAGLGLNPMNDGKLIRIPVPALSEERRKEIVKQVKQRAEEARISIRAHRQEGIQYSKFAQDKLSWSKDEVFRAAEDIQKLTTLYTKKIDEIFINKEKELLAI